MAQVESQKQIEDALFYTASSMADVAQRGRFLDQACAGNVELRQVVEEMLAANAEAEPFFNKGRLALALTPEDKVTLQSDAVPPGEQTPIDEFIGTKLGRYKLLQRIGEGGCGVVYMAEQQEPVHRRVALKVIKLGLDTKSVIARFNAERQALAMMDHPNIARVLDAGATDAGRPYFVMELVRGHKITEFCDQNHLDTQARLDLFIQVCHAVQHAHQKGIVHRDIKPSNIIVTLHDGRPVPKVIDFGIAKAIEGKLTEQTLFTSFEQLIGTPAYMSPEQAEMSGLDVDTRSDIYSLGVLLYELLTGHTPFDQKELMQSGLDEMRRKLREDEPPRPSTLLTTMHAAGAGVVPGPRHAGLPQLISMIKGDLDWIVMKALEKDRQRRYATANELAMDVGRYLDSEPVLARPPSRTYRFAKMVRRNRAIFISGGAVALALVLGFGTATWMYFREHEARQQQVLLREQAEAKEQINEAAIFVSQGQFEEANAILARVKILPQAPSFDGVLAYRRVGEWLATRQRWGEAADRYSALMVIDKLDDWTVVTLDYQACGVVLAELGDRERYNQFCRAAISRFGNATNGDLAGRILKTCLLLPPDQSMMEALTPLARVADRAFRPIPSDKFPPWPKVHLALWEYRRGNYAAADDWLRRANERDRESGVLEATLQLIRAMTGYKQGRVAESLPDLSAARQTIESRFNTDIPLGYRQAFWYDWVFARILSREAASMIQTGSEDTEGAGILE